MSNITKRLRAIVSKEHWGATSNWQLAIIFAVFSVTGILSVKFAAPVTRLIGLDRATTSPWIFWPIRIVVIFPIYQVLLVAVGTLFGQHKLFWNFEKQMLRRLGLGRRVP
jgi:hypothetical protein